MKIELQEQVRAYRVVVDFGIYLRLSKMDDDEFNIWYLGTDDGFALVRDTRVIELEAAFKEIQNGK